MSAIRSGNVRAGWAHSVRDSVIGQVVGGVALALVLGLLGLGASGQIGPNPVVTSDRVRVANVYNLPRDKGLSMIDQQGFDNVRVNEVCSNSVAEGRIREVLLDDGAPVADETVFVGPGGSKDIEVLLSTKLLVKVSTGKTC